MKNDFETRLSALTEKRRALLTRSNNAEYTLNGFYTRYQFPVLTAEHTPLFWKYDLNECTNPYLLERFSINAVFNAGAIKMNDRFLLVARIEGADRKSFFGVAESVNGIDHFEFWDHPVDMPETAIPDTNIYDMRVVEHEDGWIYGLFCTERRDASAGPDNQSAALAQCGIARTRDLKKWERLPDLITPSPQQRNVVLHPEFYNGQYAFYTRPQDGFIEAGRGGGIGFGLSVSMENAVIEKETVIDSKVYHTVYETKNGLGPSPIKTHEGWLHLAHGVRTTAAGLRYVLYMFMTSLSDITRIIYKPGGYFMAPEGEERTGDVSNVIFSNGWIADDNGFVYIYYGSSDTRLHVAVSTIDILLDYIINTPPDGLRSSSSVNTVHRLIETNVSYISPLNKLHYW